jgi:hypothetical protein
MNAHSFVPSFSWVLEGFVRRRAGRRADQGRIGMAGTGLRRHVH